MKPVVFFLVVALVVAPSFADEPEPAPVLNIDTNQISCGGISSGADFSVQFATAFSSTIMGVAVFAGQPFQCATTKFPDDKVFPCNDTKPGGHAPVGPAGCQTTPYVLPTVPTSAPGMGLLWDHCKGCTPESLAQLLAHPNLVNVSTLVKYAMDKANKGLLDQVSNLASTRAYVYRGTKDACYTHKVMEQTTEFFNHFAHTPNKQVVFVDHVPSLHCIPTLNTGTPCGTELHGPKAYAPGALHGLESCGYDGPGESLQHIYNNELTPPLNSTSIDASRIFSFDQGLYGMKNSSTRNMAFAKKGYMYIPKNCERPKSGHNGRPCKLHVFFHGCGSAYNSGATGGPMYGFNDTFISHGGWSAWGERNDIVVIYPQKDATKETCWDGYGWGGSNWATKLGDQMAAVWKLIAHVSNMEVVPNVE